MLRYSHWRCGVALLWKQLSDRFPLGRVPRGEQSAALCSKGIKVFGSLACSPVGDCAILPLPPCLVSTKAWDEHDVPACSSLNLSRESHPLSAAVGGLDSSQGA